MKCKYAPYVGARPNSLPLTREVDRLSFEVQQLKNKKRQYTNQSVKCSYHTTNTQEVCILSYTHFTLEERKYLQQLLSEGLSLRKIAAILERSPSTISREIKRNRAKFKPHRKTDNPYWYNHWRAQNLYIRRRREQQRRALCPGTESGITLLPVCRTFGLRKKSAVAGTGITRIRNSCISPRYTDTFPTTLFRISKERPI